MTWAIYVKILRVHQKCRNTWVHNKNMQDMQTKFQNIFVKIKDTA